MESTDLSLLTTLDALLQEASVTKAALRIGISTPAMSHALARLRDRIGDPLLVRAGRTMVLTPRAETMKPKVRSAVVQAAAALEPERPFSPAELEKSYVIHASDYVLTVLGVEIDAAAHREAPKLVLRFMANTPDDATALREGSADLAVGIYGDLPPELRTRHLLTDRFVCVVREDHPAIKKRLSLEQFIALEHIQVAPRGRPGGYIDDVLAERGLSRRVVRTVPFFLAGLRLVASTDYLLTISERVTRVMAPALGLRVLEPPLPLDPYALKLVWHPRFDGDPGHRWLRDTFNTAALKLAGDTHPQAMTRLSAARKKRRRS